VEGGLREIRSEGVNRASFERLAGSVSLRRDGRTSLLSWVSRTATPASTLPTVSEISIVCAFCLRNALSSERYVATTFLRTGRDLEARTSARSDWQKGRGWGTDGTGRFLWKLIIIFSQCKEYHNYNK